jgi:hypothetical protein
MEGSLIVTRRNFLVGASASLLSAPAVVRAASLMPVRNIIIDPPYWGFVDRLFAFRAGSAATKLIYAGWSAEDAAREMNRRGVLDMNNTPWEADRVLPIIRHWQNLDPKTALRAARLAAAGITTEN